MPQYVYRCEACREEHEYIQTIAEGDEFLKTYKCPDCGYEEGKRIMGKTSFKLAGSSWFRDGYQ